jgi:hypothetical protein
MDVQSVRMKGIQNKTFVSRKLSYTHPVYVIGKENSWKSFFMPGLLARKLSCGHATKNWRVTQFPLPSVLLGQGDVPCHWSCKQVQLQNLGQSKSTCHMLVGERQPHSERVCLFNALQVDWTVFLFRKDCDRTFILGHTGAVCTAPITTSIYCPMRWDTATFLPPC